MGQFLRAHWPWAASDYGSLPALLVALTVVTGLVDAVSYLALGHVFVANMTGNVVFLGFALAGAPGLSAPASLAALGAFLLGAAAGGRFTVQAPASGVRRLRTATVIMLPLLLLAVVLAAVIGQPVSSGARYALIVPLGLTMGVQNATARKLAVPDLTTTVLTMTLTGTAADSRLAGASAGAGSAGALTRRLIAVGAMFTGALVSALLVVEVDLALPLGIAAAAVLAVSVLSRP